MNKRLAKALLEVAAKPGLNFIAVSFQLPNGETREVMNTALPLPEQIELISGRDSVEVHFAGEVEDKRAHCVLSYRDSELYGTTPLEQMIAAQAHTLEEEWLRQRYVKAAQEFHHRDLECEIDDNAVVSFDDDPGAYVQAWVWVDDSELNEDEGSE